MKINISFFVVVFALSGLMVPTYSMNLTPASAASVEYPRNIAGEVAADAVLDSFWYFVGWYLDLGADYDKQWGILKNDWEQAPDMLDHFVKCTKLATTTIDNLIRTSFVIAKINNSYDPITDEIAQSFYNSYPSVTDSMLDWNDCRTEFEEKYNKENILGNLKEIIVVHSALEVSDYVADKTGFEGLYEAAGEESGIDLNNMRRNGVVLETLVALKTAELMAGEEAIDVAAEVFQKALKDVLKKEIRRNIQKDASKQVLQLFSADFAEKTVSDQISAIFQVGIDSKKLPPYVESVKKTTDDLKDCLTLKGMDSLDFFSDCIDTLDKDFKKIGDPFVKLEEQIKKCNASPENKKECDEHLKNRFAPSLNTIKNNFTLIGDCVALQDNVTAEQCAEFLEINVNLYGSLKECVKENNEPKCVEQLSKFYADLNFQKIFDYIDKFGRCYSTTQIECVAAPGMPSLAPPGYEEIMKEYQDALEKFELHEAEMERYQNEINAADLATSGRNPDPTVALNSDGTFTVFAVGYHNQMIWIRQASPNSDTWNDWNNEGGWIIQPVAGTAKEFQSKEHTIIFFGVGSDNSVQVKWHKGDGLGYSNWGSLMGWIVDPVIGKNKDGTVQVFGTTKEKKILTEWELPRNRGWEQTWGTFPEEWGLKPTVEQNKDGTLQLFVIGQDNKVYSKWQTSPNSQSWSRYVGIGNEKMVQDVTVAKNKDGRIQVFGIEANDGHIVHKSQKEPDKNSGWNSWQRLDFDKHHRELEAITDSNGIIHLFVVNEDHTLWHNWQRSVNCKESEYDCWLGWNTMGAFAWISDISASAAPDGRWMVVGVGGDNQVVYVPSWSNEIKLLGLG